MNYHSASFATAAIVTADVVRPEELDHSLLAIWQTLRAERPHYSNPFYDPHFTLAVGAVRKDARVAIFEAGGEVVGFLPYHDVGRAIAKPIGGHINDYHGAILHRDFSPTDPALIAAAGIAAYDFNHLPAEPGMESSTLRAGGASPVMDLTGGYDAYLVARGAEFDRRQAPQRRKLRKLAREFGEVGFLFDSQAEIHANEHARMRNDLYRAMGLRIGFGTGWEGEVFALLRALPCESLRTVLSVLTAGGEVVAAHFGMVSTGMLHWWFPAYDARAAKCSPGCSLLEACAAAAADQGVVAIDFGRGEEGFKRHYATHAVPLLAGSVARPATLAAAIRTFGHRTIGPLEKALPSPLGTYPRRIADRLVTGVGIPRIG